jgi:hypothetical protein
MLAKENVHEDTLVFQHPNSPYVPWDPPVRRQLLRPWTPPSHMSLVSGCYSRPLSRSGARAPEPVEVSDFDGSGGAISSSWRTFRQMVNKHVERIAKPLSHLKSQLKGITSRLTCASSASSIQQASREGDEHNSHCPTKIPAPCVRSPSAASFDSAVTDSLATWLADRRRLSLEGDYEPGSMMSVAEYNQTGSWINTFRTSQPINPMCGVPGCDLHVPDSVTLPDNIDTDSLWFAQGFYTPSRQSQLSWASMHFRSAPHLSMRCHRTTSADQVSTPGRPLSLHIPGRREYSMPDVGL